MGRHAALDPDMESSLVANLQSAFQRGRPMTNKELLKMLREQYDERLTKGRVHSFIGRRLDSVQECRSSRSKTHD
jgi:hypothetical protein